LGKWSVCVVFGVWGSREKRTAEIQTYRSGRKRAPTHRRAASQKHELHEKIIKIISLV